MNKLPGVMAVALALSGAPAAAAEPDLRITKVAAAPGVAPGGRLAVTDVVRALGSARATQVGYLLSRDARRGKGDVRLGRRAAGRNGGAGKVSLNVPAKVSPGAFRVLACADDGGRVRERSEANNCRASGRVLVVAPFEPRPLNLPAVLDTERAVSARIGPEGGTLAVVGADGMRYELVVPKHAVIDPTTLTATPVQSIPGLPFDALGGAVDLQPAGAQFRAPVTLRITSAAAPDPARVFGIASKSGGDDFHLDVPAVAGGAVTFALTHFSVHGYALGTKNQARDVTEYVPTDREAWAKNAFRETLSDNASPERSRAAQRAYLFVWATESIIPLLNRAATDDTVTTLALGQVNAWLRVIEIDGGSPEAYGLTALAQTLAEKARKAIAFAANNKYTRCAQRSDPSQAMEMLSIERQIQLLGRSEEGLDPSILIDRVRRCLHFELEFDSLFDGKLGEDRLSYRVRSVVTLPFEHLLLGVGDSRSAQGEAPITYPVFDLHLRHGFFCDGVVDSVSAPVGTPKLEVTRFNLVLDRESADPVVNVQIDTGKPYERYVNQCDGKRSEGDEAWWFSIFKATHEAESFPGSPTVFDFTGFERGEGFLFGRKKAVRDHAEEDKMTVHEELTIDIRHRPLPIKDSKGKDVPLPDVGSQR